MKIATSPYVPSGDLECLVDAEGEEEGCLASIKYNSAYQIL